MDPFSRISLVPPNTGQSPNSVGPVGTKPGAGSGQASFAHELGNALEQVENLQLEADRQAEAVAQGEGNLHETAIALEKAEVAIRLATKVRNKFVETYQEIMRMNV